MNEVNLYIITGASKGIGKAIAEELLKDEKTQVVGVSRTCSIKHPNYRHQPMDFSDVEAVEHNLQKIFLSYPEARKLVLINNAGVVGDIGYVGEKMPNERDVCSAEQGQPRKNAGPRRAERLRSARCTK